MEMAIAHQPLLSAAHLQALGTDPMLYQSRCSAWQPAVASMPPVTEIPKESIIANTDFTTTSVIAKRRLSSKKRRKLNPEGNSGVGPCSENSTRSPLSSSTASPSNTSNTCTPSSVERGDMDVVAPHHSAGLTVASVSSQPSLDASHLPHTASMAMQSSSSSQEVQEGESRQLTAATTCAVPSSHHMRVIQNQHIANPGMLSQYQQQVDYRYLQDQSLLQHQAAPVQLSTAVVTSSETTHHQPLSGTSQQAPSHGGLSSAFHIRSQSGFKWCKAHVAIAKQIQKHKQGKHNGSSSQVQQTNSPSCTVQQTLPPSQPPHNSSMVPPSHLFPPPQHHQQQQQHHTSSTTTSTPHLALMQYNLPANTVMANAAAAPTAYPPGYVAVPYSSMQELQMRMQQSLVPIPAAQIQLGNGLQVMKPVMALSDNVVGLNLGLQMIGGLHPTLQHAQVAGLAAGPPLPHTANSTAAVMQGHGPWGVAPIQGVNNSVFNHSFQPGIMATPWVK